MRSVALFCAFLAVSSLGLGFVHIPAHAETGAPAVPGPRARVLARARDEVVRGVAYDAAYFKLSYKDGVDTGKTVYPNGDLEPGKGVCTDVVIRGLRAVGIDLQSRVHEDILRRRKAYPQIEAVDRNIDHRRVGPLLTYFTANVPSLSKHPDEAPETFRPADVVIWAFRPCPRCSPDHIGFVSDKKGPRGLPLVIHNMGPAPTENDQLDAWTILGHFRLLE
jgi:uncharacterized protein YijF (DUF1287 family)